MPFYGISCMSLKCSSQAIQHVTSATCVGVHLLHLLLLITSVVTKCNQYCVLQCRHCTIWHAGNPVASYTGRGDLQLLHVQPPFL